MKDLKVVIMALGYIGLPTAAFIASKGINVQGIDPFMVLFCFNCFKNEFYFNSSIKYEA